MKQINHELKHEEIIIKAFGTTFIKNDRMINLIDFNTEDCYRICMEEKYDYICER